MLTQYGHLTYCTNIHPGESWTDHFAQLQKHIPVIKNKVCADQPFGIGLRLSNMASLELIQEKTLQNFKAWLKENDCYVFTMNGFPYGGFHHTRVKDNVHAPDWTTQERVEYTVRLARILASLLPQGMEGGISTSPLSYKFWHNSTKENLDTALQKGTANLLQVAAQLVHIKKTKGIFIHLDIEPEPDGLLENGPSFMDWYGKTLVPLGRDYLSKEFNYTKDESEALLRDHIQLCYDVCHFAVGYEQPSIILQQLKDAGIKIGKIQISAALKASLSSKVEDRRPVMDVFRQFNESTYLHQVIALQQDGSFKQYGDLPYALEAWEDVGVKEWRSHFHVPLFIEDYGVVQSTQGDIQTVLVLHKNNPFTHHLEIETYTWDVLPEALKLPMDESIIRELQWVMDLLKSGTKEPLILNSKGANA